MVGSIIIDEETLLHISLNKSRQSSDCVLAPPPPPNQPPQFPSQISALLVACFGIRISIKNED